MEMKGSWITSEWVRLKLQPSLLQKWEIGTESTEMKRRSRYFSPVALWSLNESVLCVSYPAGNTSRHMGQLCSFPPPAASPSPLTLLCTSSSSLSPTTSSLFVPFSCRVTRLSDAAAAVDNDDDAAPSRLWREGCGLMERPWRDVVSALWLCLL